MGLHLGMQKVSQNSQANASKEKLPITPLYMILKLSPINPNSIMRILKDSNIYQYKDRSNSTLEAYEFVEMS